MNKVKVIICILLVSIILVSLAGVAFGAAETSLLKAINGTTSKDQISDAMDDSFSFLLNTILPLVGAALLGIAFVMLMTGSEIGKSKVMWALIGIAGLSFVPKLIGFLSHLGAGN